MASKTVNRENVSTFDNAPDSTFALENCSASRAAIQVFHVVDRVSVDLLGFTTLPGAVEARFRL